MKRFHPWITFSSIKMREFTVFSNLKTAHFTMKFNCGNAISITAGGRARHAYIMPRCVLKIVEPAFHTGRPKKLIKTPIGSAKTGLKQSLYANVLKSTI